jgi:hypothetical protein
VETSDCYENGLVNRLVCHQWLRRRALKLQGLYVSLFDGQIIDLANFSLYHRYEVVHEHAYNKALRPSRKEWLRIAAPQRRAPWLSDQRS